nr:GrpB family protein [Pontibacter sp. HSC-14F20]
MEHRRPWRRKWKAADTWIGKQDGDSAGVLVRLAGTDQFNSHVLFARQHELGSLSPARRLPPQSQALRGRWQQGFPKCNPDNATRAAGSVKFTTIKNTHMKKSLYDLTKEDWNTRFPVALVAHDPAWKGLFEDEKKRIITKLGEDTALRIEHFGSTSIAGIRAKPYIDLLIDIPGELLFDEGVIARLEEIGYTYFKVPARDDVPAYMSFGKGYRLDGEIEQIYHIHMCPGKHVMWRQIGFRDFLNAHPERAKAYEALKLELAAKYRNDRGAYMLGKTDFIRETLNRIPW